MSIFAVLALVAIIVGIISAIIEDAILFAPLVWFVLAIAFAALAGVFPAAIIGGRGKA